MDEQLARENWIRNFPELEAARRLRDTFLGLWAENETGEIQ
jgi:hypothetical protein